MSHRMPLLLAALIALGGGPPASPAEVTPLSAAHEAWLEEVEPLITEEERRAFLALAEAYQRDGFIEAFWRARDPDPRTARNELREAYERRLREAAVRFPLPTDERRRVFLVNGEPADVFAGDCSLATWPLEIWRYPYLARFRQELDVLFYRPAAGGPWRRWHPTDGYAVLQALPTRDELDAARPHGESFESDPYRHFYEYLLRMCPVTVDALRIIEAMDTSRRRDPMVSELVARPAPADPEWLATFHSYPTELAEGAAPLAVDLGVAFAGIEQTRVRVEVTASIAAEPPADGIGLAYEVTGEVLRRGALHDAFRARFELPVEALAAGPVPLVVERPLRSGDYRLIVKVEEIGSGRAGRVERDLVVPPLEEIERQLATAARPVEGGVPPTAPPPQLRLLPLAEGLQVGMVRLAAEATDPRIRRVRFLLDDLPPMVRTRPPWTVEVDLGRLPRALRLRAEGLDAEGRVLAADEQVVNPGPHRFAVRVVSPRAAAEPGSELRAEILVPEGRRVAELELFVDDRRLAILHQPPWRVRLPPAMPPPDWVRAVARLDDGRVAEDVVLLGGADVLASVDVDWVEVFVTVLDPGGHPVDGLGGEEFRLTEAGREQPLGRFETVDSVPLHLALLVDTSASMADDIAPVRQAARGFLDRILRPDDRAAVLTFSDETRLAAPFTFEGERLALALAGLTPERSTRLWDGVLAALHYFQGTAGKRALVLLSDGIDRGSRADTDEVLAFAQHAGVAVYAISFGPAAARLLDGRRQMARLADGSGGRAFVLPSAEGLEEVYAVIERELRAQYLLAYQSDAEAADGFRPITIEVRLPGHQVLAPAGYWP